MKPQVPMDLRTPPRGFSIIELLIAIIIIGILVTILVPVISRRSEDAKITRAHQDLENLANAEERLATDTPYMGRMWLLNNVVGGDGFPFTRPVNINDRINGIRDHGIGGEYYQQGRYMFIDPNTGDIVGPPNQLTQGDQAYLSIQRDETSFGWHGPYINWQVDNNTVVAGVVGPDGIPDDPWGNNYLLFTRLGLMKEPDGTILQSVEFPFPEDNPGGLPTTTYDCLRFDRTTLLCLGPNGIPGNGKADVNNAEFGTGDDIVRKFGN